MQEKNNYCLCSVLQDILRYHKIKVNQDEIAKRLTSDTKGFRADDENITEFLREKELEYKFYWHNETPFNEPDEVLKEIQNNKNSEGFIALGNHTYRIINFQDSTILVIDPKDGQMSEKNYYDLMKEFARIDGGFGLIKKLD